MFAERKQRRALQDAVDKANDQLLALRQNTDLDAVAKRITLRNQLNSQKRKLEIFESRLLEAEATNLGIELPLKSEWWFDDSEEQYMAGVPTDILNEMTTAWLSPRGRSMVSALIRDKKDVRFERRFKIVVTAITALTGLVGVLVGLILALRRG